MHTVGEMLGLRDILQGPRLGIEVEVEGMHATKERLNDHGERMSLGSMWTVTTDGSLRNDGVEIVTKRSIHVNEIDKALSYVANEFAEEENSPTFGVRTSTHVHLNVQDLSIPQVIVLVALAGAWEPITQRYIKEARRTNLFCVPLHSCAGYQRQLRRAYHSRTQDIAVQHAAAIGKYSSINLGRLSSLGTVEFRAMHGADDLAHIGNWCRMLVRMKDMVQKFSSLDDAFDVLSQGEEEIRAYLTSGLTLNEYPGEVCSSYKDACAASMSLLSGIKYQVRHDTEHVWYYESGGSDTLQGVAPAQYKRLTALMTVEINAFSTYRRPAWDLVHTVIEEATVGSTMYDIMKVAEDTVAFFVFSTSGTRFLVLYRGQDKTAAPVQVTLRYALGGV